MAVGTNGALPPEGAMARDRTLATVFIQNADPTRYGTLIAKLANRYARRKDGEYPDDLMLAYSMLVNYISHTNSSRGGGRNDNVMPSLQTPNPETSAMTFVQ